MLDLGTQPLANEMQDAGMRLERFPLHLRVCRRCGLGQVGEYVLPERIFGSQYPYLSSTSSSWVAHARSFAAEIDDALQLAVDDLVVEVASNDGYLLTEFLRRGIPVLGVEPAANVARIANDAGVATRNEFFGRSFATQIIREFQRPRLVVANNVLAHVPDLHDFVAGIATLCDDRTVVTIENPSFMTLLDHGQFDTIYHEHFSYLTAHSVQAVTRAHGLDLVRVDPLATHGGSNRYWLRRAHATTPDESVAIALDDERRRGLFDPQLWSSFAANSHRNIEELRTWLQTCLDNRIRVAGYGAAAKGNTFLNAVGSAARALAFVVDGSVEKQHKYLPGTGIPVLTPDALAHRPADRVLILPWNLADEIVPLVKDLAPKASVWVARPEIAQLS